MSNPYQTPHVEHTSQGNPPPFSEEAATESVFFGQKLLMYSILIYLVAVAVIVSANLFLGGTPERPVVTVPFTLVLTLGILGLVAAAFGTCVGIFWMGGVLFPGSTRYIYAIGVLPTAPIIGLVVMFVASSSASTYLRARGYQIGFLGAKRRRH